MSNDPMTGGLSISLETISQLEDIRIVEQGLVSFNSQHAPDEDYQPLNIFIRANDGFIRGGLLGETYWGWLSIRIFWIHESIRKMGYGKRLLSMAEEEAVRRGCHSVHLDTMSFQARPFYERHGYTVFAILDDLPVGHQRIFLKKNLKK